MGTPLGPPTRVRSRGLGAPGWPSVPADGWVAGGWLDAGFPPRPSSPARPRIVAGVIANVAERRSEERRVGKECRSRWSAYQEKKKDGERVTRIKRQKGSVKHEAWEPSSEI